MAGGTLTAIQRDKAAAELFDRFRGLTLTTREMVVVAPRYSLGQLRPICRTAQEHYFGRWNDVSNTMEWFAERQSPPGLFD